MYRAQLSRLNETEQRIIKDLVHDADVLCKRYPPLLSIPWKILTCSDDMENGYPHTHGDTIILPKRFFNASNGDVTVKLVTLLHEKIHVYQRLHPIESNILIINYWGMEFSKANPSELSQRRSNPDVSMVNYSFDGVNLSSRYNENAKSLGDITYAHSFREIPAEQRDHPYEVMACILANIIATASRESPNGKDHQIIKRTKMWMQRYLVQQTA